MKTVTLKMSLCGLGILMLFSAGHFLMAGPWYRSSNVYYWPGRYSPAIYSPWYGGYYTGGWGSPVDALGSRYQGMADLVRAQGQSQLDRTKAMVNYQDARSKYIDNQKKLADTYVSMQKAQRAYNQERAAMEKEREAQQEAARQKRVEANEKRLASGTPVYYQPGFTQTDTSLSASQLNPATGEISWPEALMGDEYKASRDKMQELFKLRDSTGATSEISQEIYDEAQVMKNQLRGQIKDMLPNDYLAARRFIEGLSNMGQKTVNS